MLKGTDLKEKGIEIQLDKVRNIRFDLNAYCILEDIYGNTETAFKKIEEGSLRAIRALLYAGLTWEDETLTIEKVGRMVNMSNMELIATSVKKAFENSNDVIESEKN